MVRENKKGFTMVELLAVIVILGILTVAAITGVTKIIDSAKVKYYTSSIKELKLAGQSYFQDNRSSLPKQNGRYTKVTLEKLQQKKYIDKVLDWDKKECKEKESYVNAIKRGTNDYQYVAFLKCKKEEDKIPNPKAPEVDIEFYANSSDEKKASSAITIKQGNDSAYPNNGISSYQYIIYKDEKEVFSSGSVNGNNKTEIKITDIDLTSYVPATIKIKVVATNYYGITTPTVIKTKNYKDVTPPTCTIISKNPPISGSTEWINTPRTVIVGCDDGNGSGCTRSKYTYVVKKETKTKKLKVYDNAGNVGYCKEPENPTPPPGIYPQSDINIDQTNPTCTIKVEGTKGTNNWYKAADVKLTIVPKDEENKEFNSGVAKYGLTTTNSETYNNTKELIQGNTTSKGITYYGFVIDNAGNKGTCSVTVKVDKNAPSCSISRNIASPDGANNWYISNVNLTLNNSDSGDSGIAGYDLKNANSASYGKTSGTATATQSNTTGKTWYGFIKDGAGNVGTCNSGSFKVDVTDPTIALAFSSRDTRYHTSTVDYSITASDATSGIAAYCYNNGTGDCDPNTSTRSGSNIGLGFNAWDGSTKYGRACVKDNAGRKSCVTTGYAIYRQCTTTSDNGGWYNSGGCSKSCGGGSQLQYKNKTDSYLGVGCPAASQYVSCNTQSCCGINNPTGCASNTWHACREGNTFVYRNSDMIYYGSPDTVSDDVYFTVVENGGGVWKIRIPGRSNDVWIHSNCVGTANEYCTYDRCPDLG